VQAAPATTTPTRIAETNHLEILTCPVLYY
jgi:hypothetical protein